MNVEPVTDLGATDRAVRRAVHASRRWQRELFSAADPSTVAGEAPLGRHRGVAGQTAFTALAERSVTSEDLALRDALRCWVGALTVARVTEGEQAAEATVVAERSAFVRLDVVEKASFRDAWNGLVRSRTPSEATAWIDALAERGPAVSAVRRERAMREEEAVKRLGVETWEALVGDTPRETLDAAAHLFLAETRDLASAIRREASRAGGPDAVADTFAGTVLSAIARDAPEGWPARLTLRGLVGTLGVREDIGRGLRIEAVLPEAVGASSFARGLMAFGVAYRTAAAAASSLPFAIAAHPTFADAERFGFAFGALPTLGAYQRRGLGLGARVAAKQARDLARTALLHARSVAAASLLARDAARPDRARFQELTHDVWGGGVPGALGGAFPRARGEVHARLTALLTTLPLLDELRDRFDEDWFQNPHAWRALRARASGPARAAGEDAKLEPTALARALERALG